MHLMTNNFEPSHFGVKFWLASAALTSMLAIVLSVTLTVHAKSQHVDWWALYGASRLFAILMTWSAFATNYRRTKTVATNLAASEDVLLTIQYNHAFLLSLICTAIIMIIIATVKG
jgi:hypothetical protein